MTTPHRSITPAAAVRLVAMRELNTRLRTKSFVLGTAVILVVLAGYLLLQASLFSGMDTKRVGLAGQAASIAQPLREQADAFGLDVETTTVADPAAGREQVAEGELDALVTGSAADLTVVVDKSLDDQLRAALGGIARNEVLSAKLVEAGVNPDQVLADVAATQVRVIPLEQEDDTNGQRLVIGLIMVFLLYMSIVTYGSLVAQGVVEEKASRVVEILLSTVRPWHLMLGKVLGVGLVGLTQLLILAGAGLVMATATGVLTLSGVAVGTILWGLVWYLLGYFLYATVYAGAGSLVSRQEDAQSVLTPVSMVLIIGFVVGLNLLIQDPDSTASEVVSMIPLLSPVLMPGRIATGVAPLWQIGLSIVLTLLTVALFTWLAGRVYRNAVLHTGARMKLRDALKG